MGEKVKVVEVGPRDGFQGVKEFIPTEVKENIIDGIIRSGCKKVQITSFVSPRALPQMRDAREVVDYVFNKYSDSDVEFFALVPNYKGAQLAADAGLKEITPVMSLSESHNRNNVKRTCQESLDELKKIRDAFPDMKITQDIATVFGCPFEGAMQSVDPLLDLITKMREIGIHHFTLCDTIGVAYPTLIEEVFTAVRREFPGDEFNVHIHDTRNMGILNSLTALKCGADSVQTSIAGLGGCPFAPGATGNTSSEDLVYMLNKCGYDTGIDFDILLETAKYAHENIKGIFSGHHINIPEHPCVITQE